MFLIPKINEKTQTIVIFVGVYTVIMTTKLNEGTEQRNLPLVWCLETFEVGIEALTHISGIKLLVEGRTTLTTSTPRPQTDP